MKIKHLILLISISISLIPLQPCKAQNTKNQTNIKNYIDSIQTSQQIEELITKLDNRYKKFKVNNELKFHDERCQNYADSLQIKPWSIADFDNNGLNDLLVIGTYSNHFIACILDKGNGKYEIKRITTSSFQECSFPIVNSSNNSNTISYYYPINMSALDWHKPQILEQKVLIYKFGDFIEENKNPISKKIKTIEFSTSGCYGFCPIFKLIIQEDKSAYWHAEQHNIINENEFKGNYRSTIDEVHHNQIVELLNYLDFDKLKSNYTVDWTDDQTSRLKITYNNGETKSINDYGLKGTYGLEKLYQLLFEIRINQKWE